MRHSEPASLVFHPSGETHSNHWRGSEGRCFHIEIASSRLEALREQARIIDSPADFQGGPPAWLAARLYREFQRLDDLSPLAMEGLMLELLAEASRYPVALAERHPPRWLRQARELLHARFREKLSLDEVAEGIGVHPSHLSRVFQQQYHCTLGDYVRRLRIESACRQLSASDTPLIDIALELGFSDQSHFCKTFKHLMGVTPVAFRKVHRLCNSDTTQ
jgi:AraC family transcriptional regulator